MKKIIVSLLVFILVLMTLGAAKTSAATNPINIETSGDKVLFEVLNMKPGDWAERKLTVQNRGEKDFNYFTEVELTEGSEKLFNAFNLEIQDSTGVIYEGKLSDFTELGARHLKVENEEELVFVVEFPSELGNEYQGLQFDMEISFVAEEIETDSSEEPTEPEEPTSPSPEDDDVVKPQTPIAEEDLAKDPQDGDVLPKTATNTFNYLLIGSIIVLMGITFYLYTRTRKKQM